MHSELKVWVDSFPYEKEIHRISDYSGEQIYSKMALPLFFDDNGEPRYLACESYDVSSDGRLYTFNLRKNIFWSDGIPVLAKEYEAAFRAICLDKGNRFRTLLSDIKGFKELTFEDGREFGVSTDGKYKLHVQLRNENCFFIHFLCAFILSPLREDRKDIHCGPYEIDAVNETEFLIKLNKYYFLDTKFSSLAFEKILFINCGPLNRSTDPFEGLSKNKLDVSCDTAIYYDQIGAYADHENLKRRKINVLMLLSPGKMFNDIPENIKSVLNTIIDRNKICKDLHDIPKPISSYREVFIDNIKKSILNVSEPNYSYNYELIVSLEQFYPNEIVFDNIQLQLNRFGIKLKKEIDSYGQWNSVSHLRLELRKPIVPIPVVLYKADIFRGYLDSKKFRLALLLYSKIMSYGCAFSKEKCYEYLDRILSERSISIPLIEIPGFIFCKKDIHLDSLYQVGKYARRINKKMDY